MISRLLTKISPGIIRKKLIVFDIDGTLTETKSDMDPEMSRLMGDLLEKKPVAVIGGGTYKQFQKQFVERLTCDKKLLRRLFLFPTTSTAFYRYERGWKKIYQENFTAPQRKKIMAALKYALNEAGYVPPDKIYGKLIEDRGSQITFSALGQDVVAILGEKGVALKVKWTRENTPLKLKIGEILRRIIPEFEVRVAGFTSIDITRKGIDKAYGMRQIQKHLHIRIKDMLFVGDALFPGGNDYAARKTGVACIAVKGPEDTKKIIERLVGK